MDKELGEILERFQKISFREIQARCIGTTNERMTQLIGIEAELSLKGMIGYFKYNMFHTSYLKRVELQKDNIILITRNSTYRFKILDVEFLESLSEGILFSLTPTEFNSIEDFLEVSRGLI